MPSKRFTKINIDIDVNQLVKTYAGAKGISATQMLEQMVLFYINKNK